MINPEISSRKDKREVCEARLPRRTFISMFGSIPKLIGSCISILHAHNLQPSGLSHICCVFSSRPYLLAVHKESKWDRDQENGEECECAGRPRYSKFVVHRIDKKLHKNLVSTFSRHTERTWDHIWNSLLGMRRQSRTAGRCWQQLHLLHTSEMYQSGNSERSERS